MFWLPHTGPATAARPASVQHGASTDLCARRWLHLLHLLHHQQKVGQLVA
jgi:hypothetical protein